jgi:YHS domain-containing protein
MLIRIIIIGFVIYLLYRVIKYFRQTKSVNVNNHQFKPARITGEDLVEDPFCHTYIPVSQAYKKEIAGKNYCFCSKECYEAYILEKK